MPAAVAIVCMAILNVLIDDALGKKPSVDFAFDEDDESVGAR